MQLQLLTSVLALAASVSAVDIGLRIRNGCDSRSGGWTCTNWNPNTCCGIPSGTFGSIIFYAVPTNWFLELRGHEGGNCANLKTVDTIFGGTEKCLNSGPYTGAGYSFRSRKRGTQEGGACDAGPETCTSTQMPDVLFLADGQKYSIVDMDQGLIEELAGHAANGSGVADIPDFFKPFEIAQ